MRWIETQPLWFSLIQQKKNYIRVFEKWFSEVFRVYFRTKKNWCACKARVYLPHIGNRKRIVFFMQRNLLQNSRFDLSSSKIVWKAWKDIKTLPSVVRFVLRWNLLNKTRGFTFLRRTSKRCHNLKFWLFALFLEPNIVIPKVQSDLPYGEVCWKNWLK
jgi:hypothetical protein